MIRINEIKAELNKSYDQVINDLIAELKIDKSIIKNVKISRKSVDARNKGNVHFVYSVDFEIDTDEQEFIKKLDNIKFSLEEKNDYIIPKIINKTISRPIIIGSGPAGMMAGIILAEAGLKPIIIEQGKEVEKRNKDVDLFWEKGVLNHLSNVQFGEGGAGTFSDGKLMTNLKKDKFMIKVLEEFVKAGAPEEIMYMAKPHIGTDNLKMIVKNIRNKIISLGGEYLFQHKLTKLIIKDDKINGIEVENNGTTKELITDKIILAIGHSSRETFKLLKNQGVLIEPKPFSIGARIEHPQSFINKSQYGNKFCNHKSLKSAEYKLAVHNVGDNRSAYTFCMCPGGKVIGASSEHEMLAVNGMSEYARNNENANSALLVSITPKDFGGNDVLSGMHFQEQIEKDAFKLGGSNFNAPCQLVGDFLLDKPSKKLCDVIPSYKPDVSLCNLKHCLPEFAINAMREAIVEMDKKLNGFAYKTAVITGVETRSSSPIRIKRDETYQSNIKGLYPCGEGAGYAGGITSAAMDGIKCAEAIINDL
ncbi:MAG: hypothetical protein BWY78_00412 [Alphaproteobacteria bacterium ADurb.Bin438]|nr:MAG: hypothetical protein BWY78_00412 [Alphaproteobacteria bacterium ADurb.Bin438]